MCSFILDLYISINKRPKESRISLVSGYIDEMLGAVGCVFSTPEGTPN